MTNTAGYLIIKADISLTQHEDGTSFQNLPIVKTLLIS